MSGLTFCLCVVLSNLLAPLHGAYSSKLLNSSEFFTERNTKRPELQHKSSLVHEDEEENHVEFGRQEEVSIDEGFTVNGGLSVTDGSKNRSMKAGTSPETDRNISKTTAKSQKKTSAGQDKPRDKKSEFNAGYEAVKILELDQAEQKAVQIHREGADSEQRRLEERLKTETVKTEAIFSLNKTDLSIKKILEPELKNQKASQIRPTSKQLFIKNEAEVEDGEVKLLQGKSPETKANIPPLTEKPQRPETDLTQMCQRDKYGFIDVKTQEFEKAETLDQQISPDAINLDLKTPKKTYREVRKHDEDDKSDSAAEKIYKDNEREEPKLSQRRRDKTQKAEDWTGKELAGEFRNESSNEDKLILEQEMQKHPEGDDDMGQTKKQSPQTEDELQFVLVKEGQTSQPGQEELQADAAKEHRPKDVGQRDTGLLSHEDSIKPKEQMSPTSETLQVPTVHSLHVGVEMTSMKKQDPLQRATASCEVDKNESTLEELDQNVEAEQKTDQGTLSRQKEIEGTVSEEQKKPCEKPLTETEKSGFPSSKEMRNKIPDRSAPLTHKKTGPEQSRTKKEILGSSETVQESFGQTKTAAQVKDEKEKSSSPLTTKPRRRRPLDEGTSVQFRPESSGDESVNVTQTDLWGQREQRQTSENESGEKLTFQPQTESVKKRSPALNMKQTEIQTPGSPVMRAAQKSPQTSKGKDLTVEITERLRSCDLSVKSQNSTEGEAQNPAEEVKVTERRLRDLEGNVTSTEKHPEFLKSPDAPEKQVRTQQKPKQCLDETKSTGSQEAEPTQEHLSGIPDTLVISTETNGAEPSRRTEPVRTKQKDMKDLSEVEELEKRDFTDDHCTSAAPRHEPSVTDKTAVYKTQPSRTEPDFLKAQFSPPPEHEPLLRNEVQKVPSFTESNASAGTEGETSLNTFEHQSGARFQTGTPSCRITHSVRAQTSPVLHPPGHLFWFLNRHSSCCVLTFTHHPY